MRSTVRFSLLSLFLFAFIGCQETQFSEIDLPTDAAAKQNNNGQALGVNKGQSNLPFQATFYTDEQSFAPSPTCSPNYPFLNIQEGEGNATHLGKFFTHLEFCIVPIPQPQPDSLFAEYVDVTGGFFAANGDSLAIGLKGIGKIYLAPMPNTLVFRDTFLIIGGSGRFQGASGELVSESYNFGLRTEHIWTGTISK